MKEEETSKTTVPAAEGTIDFDAAPEAPAKKKRTRRTNAQIEADKEAKRDELKQQFLDELKAQGLIKSDADEKKYGDEFDNPNLAVYNRLRHMPDNACTRIEDGPLKGMTNVNPMARILMLTAEFGVYGEGWKYDVVSASTVTAGNQAMVNAHVILYIRQTDEEGNYLNGPDGQALWNAGSHGFGGSKLVNDYGILDDEAFKKAITDAVGTACKNYGMAADVYFQAGARYETKYDSVTKAADRSAETVLSRAGEPLKPLPEPKAAKEEETKSATAAAPAPASPASEAKPAPAPAPAEAKGTGFLPTPKIKSYTAPVQVQEQSATLDTLSFTHRSYTVILTYICSQKDKSEANLKRIRESYSKKINIPDEVWDAIVKTATE